nr:hypothetical protein [Tanacetum cinerariifolium]
MYVAPVMFKATRTIKYFSLVVLGARLLAYRSGPEEIMACVYLSKGTRRMPSRSIRRVDRRALWLFANKHHIFFTRLIRFETLVPLDVLKAEDLKEDPKSEG